MASLSFYINGVTSSTITVTVWGLDTDYAYQRDFYWYIDGSLDGTSSTDAGDSYITYKYTGLDSETTYEMYVDIYGYDQGYQKYIKTLPTSGTLEGTTEGDIPTEDPYISDKSYSISGTTITITVDVIDSSSVGYYVSIYDTDDNLMANSNKKSGSKTVSLSFTDSISGSKRYYIYVASKVTSSYYYDRASIRVYGDTTRTYFSWARTALLESSPSNNEPIDSGDAISTYLTAEKWELLQECINTVEGLLEEDETSFTSVSSGDALTASIFNEVRNAIYSIADSTSRSYLPSRVSSGDVLAADDFNGLQKALNSIEV